MAEVDVKYHQLLKDILDNGVSKEDRTGTGTISIFATQLRLNLSNEMVPLITTKKMHTKGIIYELFWFLGYHLQDPKYQHLGLTNQKWLVDNGVNIWVGDSYKRYVKHVENLVTPDLNLMVEDQQKNTLRPLNEKEFIQFIKEDDSFAQKWAELGPIYGKQWTNWKVGPNKWKNQIEDLIQQLKNNPDSRRLMVNAWNVGDIDEMVLPPCHYGFQCYTRKLSKEERIEWILHNCYETGMERGIAMQWTDDIINHSRWNCPERALSLQWTQRSIDSALGLPYNIASYAILTHILAHCVNMVPEELIFVGGDTHIYNNQIDGIKNQLSRNPKLYSSPRIHIDEKIRDIWKLSPTDVKIYDYVSYETIKMPLSN